MTDLRNFIAQVGLQDCRSLLQSGNLIFTSNVRTGAELERFRFAKKPSGIRGT